MSIFQVVATGSNQRDAFAVPIFSQLCLDVATVPVGSGIRLPFCQTVASILIANNGANNLNIYPEFFGTIDGMGVNSPIILDAGSRVILYSIWSTGNPNDWFSFTISDNLPSTGLVITQNSGLIQIDSQVAGATTCDFSVSNKHKVTFTANNTFTFINPTTSQVITLLVTQGGIGNYLTSWPGTVDWGVSGVPTLSTSVNAMDIFLMLWDGTRYRAGIFGQGFSG
jgi:hypothetical protein